MHISCDRFFNYSSVANFLENLSVKKIENQLRFDEAIYSHEFGVSLFIGHSVYARNRKHTSLNIML